MSGVRGLLAGLERQLILSRTQAGKEEKRKKGLHPGGAKLLPRGVVFDRKSGRWSYEEPHVSRIRLAYQLLFEEKSYYSIAAQIGGGWTAAGIKIALSNPLWTGIRAFSPSADRGSFQVRVIPEADALLSRETWEKAQAIIAERNRNWKMTKRPPRFLLAGLLRCSCGAVHYVRAKWKNGPAWQKEYYCCSRGRGRSEDKCGARSYSRESVEATVERLVTEKLLDPKLVLRLLETNKRTEPKADTGKLEREFAKLDAKRKRTVDLAVEGIIPKDELKERLAKLDREVRELRALLPAPVPVVDTRRVAEGLAAAFEEFALLPFADKRSILERAFREFVVSDGGIPSATLNGAFLASLATTKVHPHSGPETGWLRR